MAVLIGLCKLLKVLQFFLFITMVPVNGKINPGEEEGETNLQAKTIMIIYIKI